METKLGTVNAFLMGDTSVVQVQVFKFDTIRQDAYWVTKYVKRFANKNLALAYIERIKKQGI